MSVSLSPEPSGPALGEHRVIGANGVHYVHVHWGGRITCDCGLAPGGREWRRSYAAGPSTSPLVVASWGFRSSGSASASCRIEATTSSRNPDEGTRACVTSP
jgi:hypothetical protein